MLLTYSSFSSGKMAALFVWYMDMMEDSAVGFLDRWWGGWKGDSAKLSSVCALRIHQKKSSLGSQ